MVALAAATDVALEARHALGVELDAGGGSGDLAVSDGEASGLEPAEGALEGGARRGFSSLLVNLVVPAMIIDSYMIPFDPAILGNLARTALASLGVLLLGLVIAAAVTRRGGGDKALIRFAITFSNAGYMGFPLIQALFGAEGMLYASIFNTFFNILLWSVGMNMMRRGAEEEGQGPKTNPLLDLVRKPDPFQQPVRIFRRLFLCLQLQLYRSKRNIFQNCKMRK